MTKRNQPLFSRPHRPLLFRKFLISFISATSILGIKFLLGPFGLAPYRLFLLTISFATWYGGFISGIWSIGLSVIYVLVFFMNWKNPLLTNFLGTFFFSLEALGISFLIHLVNNSKQQARDALHQYQTVFEQVSDAIVVLNELEEIVEINFAARKLLGYQKEDTLHLMDILAPKSRTVFRSMMKKMNHEQEKQKEIWLVTSEGERIPVMCQIKALPSQNETVYLISWFDLRVQRQREQRKNDLLGIVSHELKTPLTSMKAFSQLLLRTVNSETKASHYTIRITEEIDRMTTLVNDLLDLSRIESGRFDLRKDLFSLEELVRQIAELIGASYPSHQITVNGHTKKTILADRDRMSQVLINVFTNAIKYSPHHKKIDVFIDEDTEEVSVSVKDHGIGISKKEQAHLFDRFFRAKLPHSLRLPGLGLGLYISHEIVRRHHGKISVKSTEGRGTTITITIPTTNTLT